MADLPYKISTLVFLRDAAGRVLLMRRAKAPNLGLWSCIGGKLEMATGESPFECARRETFEETGLAVEDADLHLFGMIAEKNYEARVHFLMFLFDCRQPLPGLPPPIAEGEFAFKTRAEIEALPVPATDRAALWPLYFERRHGFTALRADCDPAKPLDVVVEEQQL